MRNTIVGIIDGEAVESKGIALFRVAGGKLAEQWSWYPHAEAVAFGARTSIDAWLSFRA